MFKSIWVNEKDNLVVMEPADATKPLIYSHINGLGTNVEDDNRNVITLLMNGLEGWVRYVKYE